MKADEAKEGTRAGGRMIISMIEVLDAPAENPATKAFR